MSGIDEAPGGPWSTDDALTQGLADTVRRTGASIGAIYLVEEGEPALRLVAMCGLPLEFSAPWRRLPLTAPVPVADAIREDRLVWVGGQEDMARRYPRVTAVLPYRFSLAAIALTGARRCWGGLVLMWPADHPRRATPRERSHIAGSAGRLARLLDEAPRPPTLPDQPRTVSVDTEPARRSARTTPAAPTALAAADYAERLPEGAAALDLEGRITFITGTAARLLGSSADRLLGTRPWQSLPWLDNPVYEDHYRTAVISRAPLSYDALRPPDHWLTFQLYPDASGISVRITPSGKQPVPHAAPRPTAVTATGRLYQLVHLAAALTETVSVRDLVDLLAGQILPAFRAQGLVLSVADAGRLRITGHYGYPAEAVERLDGLPLDTGLTPVGHSLVTGTSAFFSGPEELARSYPRAPWMSGKEAWAFLPLVITGRPVGCCVVSYDRPHVFTADERAVLTSLAGLIAQALDRARLYDAQHQLVHGLQEALLPRALPAVAGLDVAARYLPASHGIDVGGDFYDLLRLDGTTAAAVIGDVEGHSIAAAALMGQVRTAIHAHATAGGSPDQVLARTNRLLSDLDSDLLVTCLYVHLDLARREVALASAGHVPPLLCRGLRRAEVLEVDPGPLLGIDVGARYPVARVPLDPGAVLALYTDGLVEVPGNNIDHSTGELVEYLASAHDHDLEDLIEGLVHCTWPTGRHTDDIAVLLLRTLREAPAPG
ncbi:SpoIIE family protein phosphatase [Streptomyces glomeratus]|nr:SpoIIE family protein phosphatase [Streptomyces glomeratus]MCF1506563.1 SpoIIE family protein phosphatase [Streptomyces glomeratus]